MAEISPLRRRMIEDMTVRNLSSTTQRSYLAAVSKLSRYFGRSPDCPELEDIRAFQVHLVAIGISWPALNQIVCAFYAAGLRVSENKISMITSGGPERATGAQCSTSGQSLPSADAHRLETVTSLPTLHLAQKRRENTAARGADRTPEGDGGTIYIYAIEIGASELPLTCAGENLRCKRLVDSSRQTPRHSDIRGLLERTKLPGEAIDDVIFAQCYLSVDAPALGRVAALDRGLPTRVSGLQLDRRCGSGLQAVIYASMQVATGASDIAGDAESMSNAPFFTTSARRGLKGEAPALHDSLARRRLTAGAPFPVPGGMIEMAENLLRLPVGQSCPQVQR
jgi:hypothetical protein